MGFEKKFIGDKYFIEFEMFMEWRCCVYLQCKIYYVFEDNYKWIGVIIFVYVFF